MPSCVVIPPRVVIPRRHSCESRNPGCPRPRVVGPSRVVVPPLAPSPSGSGRQSAGSPVWSWVCPALTPALSQREREQAGIQDIPMVPCSRGLAGMLKEGSGAVLFMPSCSYRPVSSCRPASSYRVVIPAKAGIQAVLAPVLSARPVSSFRLLPPLPLAAGDRVRGLLSGRGCVLPSPRPSPRGRGSRRASRTSPWSRVVGALREC